MCRNCLTELYNLVEELTEDYRKDYESLEDACRHLQKIRKNQVYLNMFCPANSETQVFNILRKSNLRQERLAEKYIASQVARLNSILKE
jgi:hypothetical protein